MLHNYKIVVRTGDRPKAGTDSNVFIKLVGDNGNTSDMMILDIIWKDFFERGQEDNFSMCHLPFSNVDHIILGRDAAGKDDEWFIDTISIINETTSVKTVFPIFRWIKAYYNYKFIPFDTRLPQDDDRTEQRRKEIKNKLEDYQIEAKQPGLPMQLKTLPDDEKFSFQNRSELADLTEKITTEINTVFMQLLQKYGIDVQSPWKSIDELKLIYELGEASLLPPPANFDRYKDDVEFGRQRLAGTNNAWIRLCTTIPSNLAITDVMVEPFLEGYELPGALCGKRIFYIDYSILDGCPTIADHVICAPIALFYRRNNGHLVPIAIQLYQKPADDNPVFLPSDPEYTWIIAKMWFNNADAAVHQSVSHLGFTHMVMEGFSAITHRNMSMSHPLFKLLAPHFLYIHAISGDAFAQLVNPGGYFDTNMNIGSLGGFELVKRYKTKWRIDVEGTLPENLKRRGVDCAEILPGYYYRDDAMLLYDTIKNYVCSYLSVYYCCDDAILADTELQNWRKEMVASEAEGGLSILGVPGAKGKFNTEEDVALVLASVIYTCSVEHAAVNFKQYDEYCFQPNYPEELLGAPPKNKEPLTESSIVDALPGKISLTTSLAAITANGTRSTQALGDYEVNYVFDPKALPVLEKFRKKVRKISNTIQALNLKRDVTYTCLDPKEIPNSISV